METVVERPGALDVHKAQVTACVRTPGAGGGREAALRGVPDDGRGAVDVARLAGRARRHAGHDGGHRRVLEAGLGDPRGRVRAAAGQRPACQAGPGPQDRHLRRRLAVPARRGGPAAGELRAAQADPHAAQPDPLSQDADPGARPGGQPAAQGARGHRHQARLRRHRHPRRLRARDARRAGRRARPTPHVLAELARGKLRKKLPALREALEGRFDRMHALWIGAILAHIDFLDEQIAQPDRGDRGADRPFRAGR